VVKPWPRLPRDAPSLEPFQARLDGALSTLIQLKMSLLTAGGWAGWPLKVPSHPNHDSPPRGNSSIADFFALMSPLFPLAPSSASLRTVAVALHILPALLLSFLMMLVLSWKSSLKRKQDEGDQPVTCSEDCWGQPCVGGEGVLSASRQLLRSPGPLLGTFLFWITKKQTKKQQKTQQQQQKKSAFCLKGRFETLQSRILLCLSYRPSPGEAQPYHCNTNHVNISPHNPGGLKGEEIGC